MKNEKYKMSKFVFVFKKNDVIALYHSLRVRVIYLSKYLYDRVSYYLNGQIINEEDQGAIEELKKNKFLIPYYYDELADLDKIKQGLLNRVNIRMMYLVLTDKCNLRCSYCFLEPNTPSNFRRINMNIPTVRQAILFYSSMRKFQTVDIGEQQEEIIHLYGGEPLINFKGVIAAVETIRYLQGKKELPKHLQIVIITNGTLITPLVARFLSDNNISVGISLDGPRIANIHRKYSKGKESFDDALRGYNILVKNKVKTGISCTITPELLDNLDLFIDFISNLDSCDGVSFNILNYNLGVSTDIDYYNKTALFIIKAFEQLRKIGIYEERMLRKITAFINHQILPFDCGANGEQIAIGPSGQVSVCHDCLRCRNYLITNVWNVNFDPCQNPIVKEWSMRSPLNMSQCLSCPALGICGGGCPANIKTITGSIWNVDKRICPHSLYSLEWMIWDQYSHLRKKMLK